MPTLENVNGASLTPNYFKAAVEGWNAGQGFSDNLQSIRNKSLRSTILEGGVDAHDAYNQLASSDPSAATQVTQYLVGQHKASSELDQIDTIQNSRDAFELYNMTDPTMMVDALDHKIAERKQLGLPTQDHQNISNLIHDGDMASARKLLEGRIALGQAFGAFGDGKNPTERERNYATLQTLSPENQKLFMGKLPDDEPESRLTQESTDTFAHLMNNGINTSFGNSKQGSINRDRVANRAAEIRKEAGVSPAQAAAFMSQGKANIAALAKNTMQITTIKPYIEMVAKNGEALKTLAAKVQNNDSKLLNKPMNWYKTNAIDDPDINEYKAQALLFQNEASRALSPSLSAVLTDSARIEMEQIVHGDLPLSSMNAVIDRLILDGNNRLLSLETENADLNQKLSNPYGVQNPADKVQSDKTNTGSSTITSPGGITIEKHN